MTLKLDGEATQLLRRIVESQAYRQIMAINILGHCLKYVTDFEAKMRVAAELDLCLRLFRDVQALYTMLGWEDIETAVRDRLEGVPYPESRLEFGVAHHVCHLAQEVAMRGYVDSSCPEFAAIARSHVEAARSRPRPTRFREFCADPTNRPRAQELFRRWFAIAIQALGRPDTRGDERAVTLGLRSKSVAEAMRDFVEALEPFMAECGLTLPEVEGTGVVLPADIG